VAGAQSLGKSGGAHRVCVADQEGGDQRKTRSLLVHAVVRSATLQPTQYMPTREAAMRKLLLVMVSVLLITSLFGAPVAAHQPGSSQRPPHDQETFTQDIPINLVFVGYSNRQINKHALLSSLPKTYTPVVRYPQFYGLPGRDMGLKFTFKYDIKFAQRDFNNDFFRYLATAGQPGDPTLFQQAYNDQNQNVLDVAGPVLYIDGPATEKWLMDRARSRLGIDTRRSYTIFFVNWYGQRDFKFHVYTKTDTPDPDTGYNFGEVRASRKMIAWGGTYGRTWFFDLSAGPEAWSNNYDVDNPDLDGNGIEDYRLPPIWEYTPGGYRDPSKLSEDLGKVARFVGIDLLFTTSPLYDPLASAPAPHGDKVTHIAMLEDDDDPSSDGSDWLNTAYVRQQFQSFEPYYPWQVAQTTVDPIDAAAQRAFRIFTDLLIEDDCWNSYGFTFAELFCFFDANRSTYIPGYGPNDYVAGVFAFHTTADNLGSQYGLLGFADDNWVDGTPSYVFEFDTADYRSLGYGFSTTTVHEVGHHIGMSHPHDGYDAELGLDFGPADDFFFAWSGDESHTIMAYIDLSTSFGQFDRDNLYRWEMAGYLNWANSLLSDIHLQADAGRTHDVSWMIGFLRERALRAFQNWNYLEAAKLARLAYRIAADTAQQLGVETTSPFAELRVVPGATAPHEGDPIRFPDN
jgi:hypothetical protein